MTRCLDKNRLSNQPRAFLDFIERIRPYIFEEEISTVSQQIHDEFEREFARGAQSVVERVKKEPRKELSYHCRECGYHGYIKLRRLQ